MDGSRPGLDAFERRELLRIARRSIQDAVDPPPVPFPTTLLLRPPARSGDEADPDVPANAADAPPGKGRSSPSCSGLDETSGAFVSIHVDGRLRGCIGSIVSSDPLHETVRLCARAAATEDSRFAPLEPDEVSRALLEISVLSAPVLIDDPASIEVGRHGLIVSRGSRKGLLLPQVAVHEGWDAATFLDQTCRKAGLPPGEWRRGARVEAFEALVFSEEEDRGGNGDG